MERPAPHQRQDLHPALYHFHPGERLDHSTEAESMSEGWYSESPSEGHYVPELYERCDSPLIAPLDSAAHLLEGQMHPAQRVDVQELRERMCELRLTREGEHGAYQCEQGHLFPQEYTDTDIRGSEPTAAEGSLRRRALSLPVQQCHRLGVAGAEEDGGLLCCCKLKKKVQFADTLGLCLASVKHFLPSEEPLVPPSVLARLQSYPPTVSLQRAELSLNTEESDSPVPQELCAKVEAQGVCLEQASDTQWGVRGCALVRESEGAAQVKVRYSFNDWLSHLDCPATAASAPAPGPQRFLFTLCYPPATARVQFAICCSVGNGQELWDNNQGLNYCVYCQQEQVPHFQASDMEQEESCTYQHW
ncbi:hypothetical protein XENTR_v10016613 [Xenopus tropicalis]|uniref:Protein phosphatase 1 regulatory subunit 3G n=1 Tax=Xenopus tropicalis TaxID=8364 RepID=A0A8J0R5C8_XENTR|nr:protein phosphatase 1 regulatory subunit 3G [Xenopus tropicalis]KAE8597818.1 hypothetical protein XENTR_v10016613 [Xenopus tropicalis]